MGFRSGIPILGFTIAAAIVVGCAADSLTLPGEGEPASVSIVNGNDQQGMAGDLLTDSLVVIVTDAEDRPVVSRSVSFNIASGGTIQPATVATNGEGKAVFHWVLGPPAGEQTLDVGLGSAGQLSPKATFTALALAGPVQTIAAVSGDGQTAPSGTALPQPLVVRLRDSFGNGVAGASVAWQASSGNLSGSPVTSEDGTASVLWTLGSAVGVHTVAAQFAGAAGSPVSFTATASQGPSPRLGIVTQPATTAQSGVILSRQPEVRLETAQGSPIAQGGVAVTAAIASGGGALSGTTTVQTNATGLARFTDLTITGVSGTRTLIFAAAGHTTAISENIVLSAPPLSASLSTVSVSPSTINAGVGQSTVTVTARDEAGNPIAGLSVVISASGSGNTISQPIGPTNSNGVATGIFSSTVAGSKSVSAEIGTTSVIQTATVTVIGTSSGPSAPHSTAHVPGGKVLRWTTITITTRDDQGNQLTGGGFGSQIRVSVSGSNNVSSLTVFDQGDGTYEASYFPLFKGTDQVSITINGIAIQGSPYSSKVK